MSNARGVIWFVAIGIDRLCAFIAAMSRNSRIIIERIADRIANMGGMEGVGGVIDAGSVEGGERVIESHIEGVNRGGDRVAFGFGHASIMRVRGRKVKVFFLLDNPHDS